MHHETDYGDSTGRACDAISLEILGLCVHVAKVVFRDAASIGQVLP